MLKHYSLNYFSSSSPFPVPECFIRVSQVNLTALIECLTVLLEYIDHLQNVLELKNFALC